VAVHSIIVFLSTPLLTQINPDRRSRTVWPSLGRRRCADTVFIAGCAGSVRLTQIKRARRVEA